MEHGSGATGQRYQHSGDSGIVVDGQDPRVAASLATVPSVPATMGVSAWTICHASRHAKSKESGG